MSRTLSTTEAKNQLSAVIGWVVENRDEVIIESHGKPRAVIISFEELQEFKAAKERDRRRQLRAELDRFSELYGDRNSDLSDEEVEGLANRFAHEMFEDMEAEGVLWRPVEHQSE